MSETLLRLARRRECLVAQATAQRVTLAKNIEPWRQPLARADQGVAALRAIGRHPAWIAGGVILLALLRPARAGKWLRRGWVAWRLLRGGLVLPPGARRCRCRHTAGGIEAMVIGGGLGEHTP